MVKAVLSPPSGGLVRLRPRSSWRRSRNLSPERLIALAGRGNRPAFERLADDLTGPVLAVVGHVVTDRGQAEELTRQVLVELWCTASRYREADGTVRTWALSLAHRHAVAHLRARATSCPPPSCATEHRLDDPAFTSLTATQRDAVLLAYCGGRTYREIASALALAPDAVAEALRTSLLLLHEHRGAES